MNMKDSIVLYPALGNGHLMPMVELGKLISTHNPSLSIIILILTPPNKNNQPNTPSTTATTQYISAVSAAAPSITFHYIPPISFPGGATLPSHILTLELSRRSNQHVLHVLQSISKTSSLKAVILDFFNYTTTQVTATINIPTYFYYTSGASTLAVFLQLPSIDQNTQESIKDLHKPLLIPGLPNIHPSELPLEVQDRASRTYHAYLDLAKSMRDSDGIIINTFDGIEGRVITALSNGLCLPKGTTPPLFCVGPVTSAPCGGEDDVKGCLCWLDLQPRHSVVLLCFGSAGKFSRAQLKEIAIGLEKSEQRFLWVVRSESDSGEELSLDELLPEGFLERTKEKGMVVRDWAPQAAILSHDSVGGFVTHCGWNSVLEAVCEGVPMVAWPLYGEQKLNRVIMVKEMKVALAVNMSEDGFVSATELRDRVKELMDSGRGQEIRQRIFKMKISPVEARGEGGSSFVALKRLTQKLSKF